MTLDRQILEISANQISTKRGFPVYRTNPSVPQKSGLPTRTKRIHVPGGKAAVIVDNSSGEIKVGGLGFWWEEEVDSSRFVKLFLDGIKQATGLSKAGFQVFELVYHELRANPGRDEIKLNQYVAKDHNISDRTYQRGVRELLEKEFLYRSPSDGVFFVNIRFMFNGDRLAFVKSSASITTNQGNITLSGTGSFGAISSLATNSDSFTLENSANFSTSGGFTNNGTVTLGPSSKLSVNGTLSEGSGATLVSQIGGTPASGSFGTVAATGAATLGGTLTVALVNSFVPSVSSYTLMTFPSHSSNFSGYNLPTVTQTAFAVTVNPGTVVLGVTEYPISSVTALQSTEASPSFTVSWSGTPYSGGPPIQYYDVYDSNNGGPYTEFVNQSNASSATFNGQYGHTYGFYSIAVDTAGNVQPTPSGAQATTYVLVPTITVTPTNFSPIAGRQFTDQVASFTDSDPSVTSGVFTATITWSTNNTSAGTVTNGSGGTFLVTGSHTYYTSGQQPVSIKVYDSSGDSGTGNETITIAAAPLSEVSADNVPETAGIALSSVPLATFTDGGGVEAASFYSATINWNDGTGSTTAGTVNISFGQILVSGTHTYQLNGTYDPIVTLTDDVSSATATNPYPTVTVANPLGLSATPFTATAGQVFSGQVAAITDANTSETASQFTSTITWGDGNVNSGTVTGSDGSFVVDGSDTYSSRGVYPVSVQVTDAAGNTASANQSIGVTGPLTLSGPAIYLKLAGQNLDVWDSTSDSGAPNQVLPSSTISSVAVIGVAGGTTLIVDFSAGDPLPAAGLNFNRSAGASNTLKVVDTGDANAANFTVNGSEVQVAVSTGTAPITYSSTTAIGIYAGQGADSLTQNAQPGGGASLSYLGTTASDGLTVNAGTFTFAAAAPESGVTAVVLGNVAIAAGANLVVAAPDTHSDRYVMVLDSLTIAYSTNAWKGQLNLTGNDLIVHNGNVAQITSQIASGYNNGTWTGQGLTSSTAGSNTAYLTTLGAELNKNGAGQLLYGSGTALGLFDGQNPAVTDVLVKYTYYGDANLNGTVDGSDYSLIDNGYLNHLTGWYNGDFNYDGVVDGSDYTLIDNAFNRQGASLAATISVPAAEIANARRSPARSAALFSQLPIASVSAAVPGGSEVASISVAAGIFGADTEWWRSTSKSIDSVI